MSESEKESVIRPVRQSDLPAVMEIEKSWESSPGWSTAQFEAELTTRRSRFLVAEEGGRPVGFAVLWIVTHDAQLMDIAVHPERARRGIGRRLLERMMEAARKDGCTRMLLEVGEENTAARALYDKLGFKAVGKRPKYYRDGSDAVLMDRVL